MCFDGASLKASKLNRLLCQNKKNENKFTFTWEEIQNQCISILFMTLYFVFKLLFVNLKLAI